ncbi:cyclic GMP-AMP synthase-like receptor 3 [Branchiostoma floridae x Branchiostoma japonicum]
MNEVEAAFVLLVFLSIVIGILVFVVWMIYKACRWLTGNEDEHTRRPRSYHGYRDSPNPEPERHVKAKEEVRLPEAYEYRRSVNDNAVPERHPGYRHRFNTEPERRTREDVASRMPGWHMGRDYSYGNPERQEGYRERFNPNLALYNSLIMWDLISRGYQYRRGVSAAQSRYPVVVPESRSNLVNSSVVPDCFEEMSLTEKLKKYHNKKLKLDDDQTKRAKELVRNFIGSIVDSVKEEIDAGRPQRANRCRIEYTGSMYEGTKFGQPDEFDIMVVIDGSEDIKSEEGTPGPGYARLRVGHLPHRFSRCVKHSGCQHSIDPTKMIDWFYALVQKGVNKVSHSPWDHVSLKVSRHGPAVMVNIKEGNGLSIDVDLVLCIQLDQQTYYVAKPYKPYADVISPRVLLYDPTILWRQSFSVTETRSLSRIDGANECRRDCLRVLKSVFRREPGLDKFTSFHLKTVLLRMCEEENQWQSSKMGERFLDLLKRIESCLRERHLPHFYLPELNLLDGIRHKTIENMRDRIKRLIDSEHERSKVLYSP